MTAQPLEGQSPDQGARFVLEHILKPIDGVRGTWSWMLEPGNHGHGLVPFIVDLEWWDQCGSTVSITKGSPEILPAFINWRAIKPEVYDCYENYGPLVEVVDSIHPGYDSDYHTITMANYLFDEDCYFASGGERDFYFAAPVWAVTPISQEFYNKWGKAYEEKHRWIDGWVIDSITSDGCSYHGEYVSIVDGKMRQCEGVPEPDSGHDGCACGLEDAQQRVSKAIYERELWIPPDEEFAQVWSWTVNRWVQAWQGLHRFVDANRKEDPYCLSSLVSSHSPYFRTLDSDDLAQEIRQLSSIHSTSSRPWQESSTEPSPQLTLFDT